MSEHYPGCACAACWPSATPDVAATALADAIDALRHSIAFDPRDWSEVRQDAWLYAILVGWGDRLAEVANRHSWTAEDVDRVRRYRNTIDQHSYGSAPRWGTHA